jgi:ribose transport system permease protein
MSNKVDLREGWRNFNRKNTYVLSLIIFIITTVAYLLLQPNVFDEGVISRLLTSNFRTWLPVILLAIGQTIVMLGGGLDLSSGALVSLGNVILAISITSNEEPWFNLLIVLGVVALGLIAGFFNGILTAYLGLQPMITTFATSFVYSGLALLILPNPWGNIPREYTKVYRNTSWFGIPLALFIIAIKNRRYGHFLLAVGGKADAAYYTGVRVRRIRISTYVISGLFASLAAICYTLLTGSGSAVSGAEMTLSAITAAILGGTSMAGGSGSLIGSVLGAIILGTIKNLISLSKMDSWYRVLVNATVIILALASPGIINLIRRKK